jgi:hypothetical protein
MVLFFLTTTKDPSTKWKSERHILGFGATIAGLFSLLEGMVSIYYYLLAL